VALLQAGFLGVAWVGQGAAQQGTNMLFSTGRECDYLLARVDLDFVLTKLTHHLCHALCLAIGDEHGPGGELAGSVLLAYAGRGVTNGPPFIRLAGNNAVLSGFVITYPEWKQADVPPVPYPPCVLCEGKEDVAVENCLLLNPYEGIKMVGAARHWIRNVTG